MMMTMMMMMMMMSPQCRVYGGLAPTMMMTTTMMMMMMMMMSPQCRVYGLAPTSVISAVATISGVVCAVLMPFIGAIVDYSTRRWEVNVGSALLLVATNAVQVLQCNVM